MGMAHPGDHLIVTPPNNDLLLIKPKNTMNIRGRHGSSGKLNFPKNGHMSCGGGTRAECGLGIP